MTRKILVLLFIFFGYLRVAWTLANKSETIVKQDSPLSRRVRALIFPKKASALITAALTKIIVGGRPSGLQYSLEFDMYVPLPDSVEGWRPNIHRELHNKNKKQTGTKSHRRWDGNWQGYWPNSTRYSYPQRGQDMFYNGPNYYYANKAVKPKTHKDYFYKSPWQLTGETWDRNRQVNVDEEKYESWAHVPSWKLNRGYRERRAIFDQLDALGQFFLLDLKSCIKRAMCELQAKFNEHHGGGMLMNDVLRIILTVPEDVADDKYQYRVNVRDCARFYAVSCPYEVLDFLTWNSNISKTK